MPAQWFTKFYDRFYRGREIPTEPEDGDFFNFSKNNRNGYENSDNLHMGDVCSIFDSPYRILRVAANGSFQEFKRLYEKDNKRLCFRDVNGALAIHHAAGGGNVEILRFILEKGTDVEETDKNGNTALHWAAEKNRSESIEVLLQHRAKANRCNIQDMSPLHTACEMDMADAVRALCVHQPMVDINYTGDLGQTALHFCVIKNSHTSLSALLDYKPSLFVSDRNGACAVHAAATHASSASLEVLLSHSWQNYPEEISLEAAAFLVWHISVSIVRRIRDFLKIVFNAPRLYGQFVSDVSFFIGDIYYLSDGYGETSFGSVSPSDREKLLTLVDKEGNTALHAAVNSGDLKTVEVCLDHGSQIDTQQCDMLTPLHLACAQGALEMVRAMLSKSDDPFTSLGIRDVQKQTPLHKAAMFDHHEVVSYILNEGCDIDAVDRQRCSPLLLATTRGAWRSVQLLIENSCDLTCSDSDNRNVLHLSVLNGGNLEFFGAEFFKRTDALELMNQADCTGCTPMHYATQQGNLKSVQGLIDLGARVNLKNKQKQSPLHFAARYGRLNSCKRLLDSPIGPHILNESDGEGRTALHIAAANGHTKFAQLLLRRGSLLHKDHTGRTPLHLAAIEGFVSTLETLLATHPHLLNQTDDAGNTALQVAACAGRANVVTFLLDRKAAVTQNNLGLSVLRMAIECCHRDVAMAIIANSRWKEAMDDCPRNQEPYMLGLIKYLPDVALAVLNRCHKKNSTQSGSHKKEFDFRYLRCTKEDQLKFRAPGENIGPLIVLNTMVKHNRIDLLSHPVCVNYLHMKWHSYGRLVHVTTMGIYLLFVASLTLFTFMTHASPKDETIGPKESATPPTASHGPIIVLNVSEFTSFQFFIVWFITIFSMGNILKEVGQFLHQRQKYLTEITNIFEWVLFITSILFVGPCLLRQENAFQWPCGAIAVFLAWFNFLLYLQRFDIFGIYVVMFLEILRTLCQVLLVFSILIIAFALTFHILLPLEENHAHNTPLASLLRVALPFLLGELDFVNSFVEPSTDGNSLTLPYPVLTFIFLSGLVLLLPILLINLLIGLAVGDIASMQRNAQLKRLAMQVELHTDLEQKLPNSILKAGDKEHYTVQSNCAKFYLVQIWEKLRATKSGLESFYGHASESDSEETQNNDPQLAALRVELNNQKRRWTEVKTQLDRQHDMLKLILQKMEIQSEAEERDEGVGPGFVGGERIRTGSDTVWSFQDIVCRRESRSPKNYPKILEL